MPWILLLTHIASSVPMKASIIHQKTSQKLLNHFSWLRCVGMLMRRQELKERLQALRSLGPQTEPADHCLFLLGPNVYFHEGINVYFDMPLVLF